MRAGSGFWTLRLPFVLEHGRAALDLAQTIAVPHELRSDPEFRLDAERRFKLKRGFGRNALLSAENTAHFRNGHAHALCESGLREPARLDELLTQNLPWTLGWLRRGNANGKNQAMTGSRVGFAGGDCGAP